MSTSPIWMKPRYLSMTPRPLAILTTCPHSIRTLVQLLLSIPAHVGPESYLSSVTGEGLLLGRKRTIFAVVHSLFSSGLSRLGF
jgi:hypothetical protein